MKDCCEEIINIPANNKHGLYPLSSNEEKCSSGHFWGPGVRPYYLLHYIISGKGVFYSGTKKYELSKGQMFAVFPHNIVKYQADKEDPWHYIWVIFSGDEAKEILSEASLSIKDPVFEPHNGEKILSVMRSMQKERSADMSENLKFTSLLYEFMSLMTAKSGNLSEANENSYFYLATRFIKAHFSEDITVDKIASFVGLSRKYLYTVFKKECGSSPQQYLIDYRMEKAREFLMNKELSVGNVSYSVGYEDPLVFSKMFKQKNGISPTQYREVYLS